MKEANSLTRRRVEITLERERLLVVERREVSITDWCGACGSRVRMVMPEEAARLTGATARLVYRLVETGQLHYFENPEVGLLICFESLNNIIGDHAGPQTDQERKGV
jgi:hypothetical protein